MKTSLPLHLSLSLLLSLSFHIFISFSLCLCFFLQLIFSLFTLSSYLSLSFHFYLSFSVFISLSLSLFLSNSLFSLILSITLPFLSFFILLFRWKIYIFDDVRIRFAHFLILHSTYTFTYTIKFTYFSVKKYLRLNHRSF